MGRHVTKYSLAEVEAARDYFADAGSGGWLRETVKKAREIALHYLQATINQRTRSTGPRAKGGKPKGEA